MMNVCDLLERAKVEKGIPSNYRLAREIGVSDQTLNNWTHGKAIPSRSAVKTLAKMAKIDVGTALVEIDALREEDQELRAALLDVVARLKRAGSACVAAVIALLIGIGGGPDANASQQDNDKSQQIAADYRFDNLS